MRRFIAVIVTVCPLLLVSCAGGGGRITMVKGEDGAPSNSVTARIRAASTKSMAASSQSMRLTADLDGTVTEVLAKNGDAVEFNQPLFRVKAG